MRELDCFVTVVTAYELLFGVARARRQIGEDDLLDAMQALPLDIAAARHEASFTLN